MIPDAVRAARRTAADLDAAGRHAEATSVRALCEAHLTLVGSLTTVVTAAVEAEREGCAEDCDALGDPTCSRAIRARKGVRL